MPHCLSWSAQGNWYERHYRTVCLACIHTFLGLWNLPRRSLEFSCLVKKFAVDPVRVLICFRDTWKSIIFLTVGFMGLRCVVPFSVQEKRGLFVGRDQRMFSLCLPLSAHFSASSFRGSPRCAFILMKMGRRPCSIHSHKSCTMSLMMSASGFPHIKGDLPSPIHFLEEDIKHVESDKRIIVLLFCLVALLEALCARIFSLDSWISVLFWDFFLLL